MTGNFQGQRIIFMHYLPESLTARCSAHGVRLYVCVYYMCVQSVQSYAQVCALVWVFWGRWRFLGALVYQVTPDSLKAASLIETGIRLASS